MALNSNWPSIDPGEFRHQFTLLEQTIGSDASGMTVTYAAGGVTAWGKQEFVRGAEVIKSGQDAAQVYLKITMWYQPQFAVTNQRIQGPNGSVYLIQYVENVAGMNTYLVLTCIGVGANL